MTATIDTDLFFGKDDEFAQAKKREVEALNDALKQHISPKGALGLPPLLDKRRLEYGLPDEIFDDQCMYEFVHVYQLDLVDTETVDKESLIVRPDAVRDRDRKTAHRGILVGAGLKALDIGISNGWALGHLVNFVQLAPYRQRKVTIRGKEWHVLCMQAGDIRSSVDLREALRTGVIRIVAARDSAGRPEHRYVYTESGEDWTPTDPWIPDNA